MQRSTAALGVAALTLTAGLVALPSAPSRAAQVTSVSVADLDLEQLAHQVQLVGVSFTQAGLTGYGPAWWGGIYYQGDAAAGSGDQIRDQDAALVAAADQGGSARPFVATDEEGGGVQRLAAVIGAIPWQRDQAARDTPAQVQQLDADHGAAMRRLGFTMDLAPVVDTSDAGNQIGAEGLRSFSDSGTTVGAYGNAAQRGYASQQVVPVGKHFPGIGHDSANTDEQPATDPPLPSLRANDLKAFQAVISGGIPAIMMSHASVPGLTGSTPTSLSPAAYTYLADLGFHGLTVTDSLAAGALSARGYDEPTAAVAALQAGADLLLTDAAHGSAVTTAIEQAVQDGSLPLDRLRDAAAQVLVAKGVLVIPANQADLGRGTPAGPAVPGRPATRPTTPLVDGLGRSTPVRPTPPARPPVRE